MKPIRGKVLQALVELFVPVGAVNPDQEDHEPTQGEAEEEGEGGQSRV